MISSSFNIIYGCKNFVLKVLFVRPAETNVAIYICLCSKVFPTFNIMPGSIKHCMQKSHIITSKSVIAFHANFNVTRSSKLASSDNCVIFENKRKTGDHL